MILRALFWVAIVAVLMPREPDLGLGRPNGVQAALPALAQWTDTATAAPQRSCPDQAQGCKAVPDIIDAIQNMAVRGLAQVKSEIEADQRKRARHMAYRD